MPYCTVADITRRLPEETLIQLTDDAGADLVDAGAVDAAVADADELIDGHLRGRYALPLDPVPGMIKSLSLDLVIFGLYGRRPEYPTPESVKDRQKVAMEVLRKIQTGAIQLGSAGAATPAESSSGGKATAPGRLFDRDTMDRY